MIRAVRLVFNDSGSIHLFCCVAVEKTSDRSRASFRSYMALLLLDVF